MTAMRISQTINRHNKRPVNAHTLTKKDNPSKASCIVSSLIVLREYCAWVITTVVT
jgi:hypothetical protein